MRIILVCIFASFVISGLLNPIGLISGPISEAFNISLTDVVTRFGYFTFGAFGGYILSFIAFDYIRLKVIVVTGYLLLSLTIVVFYLFNDLMSYCLFLIGVFISLEVCAASTLASWTWTGKPRQTVLIGQDAMFNGGGIIFTALTTYLLVENYHWGTTYLIVAGVAIFVAILALTSDIKEVNSESEISIQTTWNIGILGVGASILLFMTAKISIFIWAPQYAVEAFDATIQQSGRLLTNIFTGAFLGSLAGTFIVSRVRIEYFLMVMLLVGAGGLFLMISVGDISTLLLSAYIVGASVGATFNGYMAFGLSFLETPTHKNVAYILVAGGLGSSIAPIFSSQIVESSDSVRTALLACFAIQIVVLVSVVLLTAMVSKNKPCDTELTEQALL
ncbi:MAG: MFS transporter [Pseudomonadales bacterium]|nr:MFS transporter [Pseudomonadales bacterium]